MLNRSYVPYEKDWFQEGVEKQCNDENDKETKVQESSQKMTLMKMCDTDNERGG